MPPVLPGSRLRCGRPRCRGTVPGVHALQDLLPYLAGLASGFAVQFLIQVYVVPRVESGRRRDERWKRDVLDLGDLLTGQVSAAGGLAEADQRMLRAMRDFPIGTMDPEEKRQARERVIWEQREKARQSSGAFAELVRSRADWLADRVTESRMDSKEIVPLVQASYLYRIHVLRLGFYDVDELTAPSLRSAGELSTAVVVR
jgi:hypothetical protein